MILRLGKLTIEDILSGSSVISVRTMVITFLFSIVVGIYIYYVFKSFSKTEFYSKDLNISLACIVVVVASIMLAMQSNLIVSLGMVGALSIVRFRTAIKSPIDLLYLFWAISEGIIIGVNIYILGIMLCIVLTVLLFVLERIPNSKAPALLVIKAKTECSNIIEMHLKENSKWFKEKARSFNNNCFETIYELDTKNENEIIKKISEDPNITFISLLNHNGETRI